MLQGVVAEEDQAMNSLNASNVTNLTIIRVIVLNGK
ncbi:hypothetical protein A2U01_0098460, partial [Trifolium medium]|nr:hypothetical protein [Trifolium medium]